MPMPIFSLSFGEYKSAEISGAIDSVKEAISDWTPYWFRITPIVNQAIADNFAQQGSIEGPWPELKPETLKEKRRKGYPDDILVRSGRLKVAATSFSDALIPGPDQIIIAEPELLELGLVIDYGYYWDRPEGVRGIQREFFALTDEAFTDMLHAIGEELHESAEKAWAGEGV